MSVLMTCNDFR